MGRARATRSGRLPVNVVRRQRQRPRPKSRPRKMWLGDLPASRGHENGPALDICDTLILYRKGGHATRILTRSLLFIGFGINWVPCLIRFEMKKCKTNRIEQVLVRNSSLVSGLSEASGARLSWVEVSQKVRKLLNLHNSALIRPPEELLH